MLKASRRVTLRNRPRKPGATFQRGFTLVELVTGFVIAGILAAMVAPRFFERNVFESRGFYDQVVSTLRYAQKVAIAQNRYVCVAFTANSITLTHGATAACGSNLAGPTGQMPYSVSSNSASFQGGAPTAFNFNALGKPSPVPAPFTVSGYANSITVEAETGYVH